MPNVTILNRCEGQITREYEIFNIPGIGNFSGIEAYTVESGFTATVTVNDVGYCKFQHWDDGDTSRTKTLVAGSEDIVLYAITSDAAVNKVVIGETILLDLSEDSLDSTDELKYGETAHSRDGKVLTGTGRMVDQTQSVTQDKVPTDTTYTDTNGIKLNGTAEVIPSRTSYISDKNQTVYVGGGTASSPTAGYIPSGNGNIIEIDSASKTNLVSGNIKSGVSILGVDGELSSSDYTTFNGNSLFGYTAGSPNRYLYITDNKETIFYGYGTNTLDYMMNPSPSDWLYDFKLEYKKVQSINYGFGNYTFRYIMNTHCTNIELRFPLASSVSLPIVLAADQSWLQQRTFIPIIQVADECEFNTSRASNGCIIMSADGTPNGVFWLMTYGSTNGISIMNGNEQTIYLDASGTHVTLGNYEWWDTSGAGTSFKCKKIS